MHEVVKAAYAMEEGLRHFYHAVSLDRKGEPAQLLRKLAAIEEGHKRRLTEIYMRLTDSTDISDLITGTSEKKILEGGFTMEEFLRKSAGSIETEEQVLTLAMMLEAQALDLYLRYSRKTDDQKAREILHKLGDEEKAHLSLLGNMMEKTA
ncbi:MAG: hypothetical protein C4582_06625 [Desulfobacteraceae bacterium]|nr:MAG: hypothetical protein C4582_06625 [Desulfobacteraceae bacterium]